MKNIILSDYNTIVIPINTESLDNVGNNLIQ